jgi:hypothetical protein
MKAPSSRRLQSLRQTNTIGLSKCRMAKYHSYDHPSSPPYSPTAQLILSAALKHVPISGFSTHSLRAGAQDAGYLSTSTNLFPQGAFDLVAYYLVTRRLALQDLVNDTENGYAKEWTEKKTGVGARVRRLLLDRLRMNAESGVTLKWPEVWSRYDYVAVANSTRHLVSCLCHRIFLNHSLSSPSYPTKSGSSLATRAWTHHGTRSVAAWPESTLPPSCSKHKTVAKDTKTRNNLLTHDSRISKILAIASGQ